MFVFTLSCIFHFYDLLVTVLHSLMYTPSRVLKFLFKFRTYRAIHEYFGGRSHGTKHTAGQDTMSVVVLAVIHSLVGNRTSGRPKKKPNLFQVQCYREPMIPKTRQQSSIVSAVSCSDSQSFKIQMVHTTMRVQQPWKESAKC